MKALMKTTKSAKPAEVEKKWHLIDADGLVVGRLATIVANILRGKHKPSFTPHVDCGDHVVIVNADKVRFTGRKLDNKIYYKHTGYAGGIKSITAGKVLEGRFPERVLEKAIERMIPRGPLGRQQMRNLRLFNGPEHAHTAQNPELLDIAAMNRKNKVGAYCPTTASPSPISRRSPTVRRPRLRPMRPRSPPTSRSPRSTS